MKRSAIPTYRRKFLRGASCLAVALSCAPLAAQSQGFPIAGKTVRLVSGASAGSASDIIGRAVAEKLQAELGVSVVMENRTGAAGTIAAQNIVTSPPDGHSIFVYTAAHTVTPLISKVPYDALRDFAGVTPLAVVPNVMVVAADKGYKTVKDVVDAAKAKPGVLNYASVGVGTATYMNAEKFRIATGISADASRLAFAKELGADLCVDVQKEDVVDAVRRATRGGMAASVLDVTGSPEAIALSVKLVRTQGTVVCASSVSGNRPSMIDTNELVRKEVRFQGVWTHSLENTQQAMTIAESGKYPLERFMSHEFPLEEAERAIRSIGREIPEIDPIKVSIKPW